MFHLCNRMKWTSVVHLYLSGIQTIEGSTEAGPGLHPVILALESKSCMYIVVSYAISTSFISCICSHMGDVIMASHHSTDLQMYVMCKCQASSSTLLLFGESLGSFMNFLQLRTLLNVFHECFCNHVDPLSG